MWLGVDPLAHKYPMNSPYVYCNGNPVRFIDPDGREDGSFLNFIGSLRKSVSVSISFGIQAGVQMELDGVKIGAKANLVSVNADVISQGEINIADPPKSYNKEGSVSVGVAEISIEQSVSEKSNIATKKTTMSADFLCFEGKTTETELYSKMGGEYRKISKERGSEVTVPNISMEASLILGIELEVDVNTVAKAVSDYIKVDNVKNE